MALTRIAPATLPSSRTARPLQVAAAAPSARPEMISSSSISGRSGDGYVAVVGVTARVGREARRREVERRAVDRREAESVQGRAARASPAARGRGRGRATARGRGAAARPPLLDEQAAERLGGRDAPAGKIGEHGRERLLRRDAQHAEPVRRRAGRRARARLKRASVAAIGVEQQPSSWLPASAATSRSDGGERRAAGVGRGGLQPAGDRAAAAVEHGGVLVQLPAGVDGRAERVELERELLGIRVRRELAALDRGARVVRRGARPSCVICAATASRTGPGRPSISIVALAKKQPPANVPRSM